MYILGIDTSTKTGVAVLSDDPKFYFVNELEAKKLKGLERLVWFRKTINALLDTYPVEIAVIENYGFANAFTLVPLVEIGTVVRMVLHDRGVPCISIPPNTLKKTATGKGAAKKDEIMLAVYKRWGFTADTNNIADAYVLARIGLHIKGLETFTKDVSEGISKIESVQSYRGVPFVAKSRKTKTSSTEA